MTVRGVGYRFRENERRPSPFNSIKYRLALIFFAITAGAILVIYFYVVPQLESSLTSRS